MILVLIGIVLLVALSILAMNKKDKNGDDESENGSGDDNVDDNDDESENGSGDDDSGGDYNVGDSGGVGGVTEGEPCEYSPIWEAVPGEECNAVPTTCGRQGTGVGKIAVQQIVLNPEHCPESAKTKSQDCSYTCPSLNCEYTPWFDSSVCEETPTTDCYTSDPKGRKRQTKDVLVPAAHNGTPCSTNLVTTNST